MGSRWLSEQDLLALPASMTERALGGKSPRKKSADAEHLRMPGDSVAKAKPKSPAGGSMKAMQALGRLEKGELNKTEQAYQNHLDKRRMAGEVMWYRFEPFRMTLAPKTTYTADFLVQLASGHLEVHEVKGFWTEDARVKIKVAAALLPVFKFVAIQMEKGTSKDPVWIMEEFPCS